MQKYSFFNSVNGDRKYKAEDLADYYSSFIGNGVFPLPKNGLKVQSNNGMSVKVSAGKAWINGYFFNNTDNEILNIDAADGLLKRIDRVIVCLDFLNRCITLTVKKGEFASTPIAPTLQRDSDKYELALADILINNGITIITEGQIIDQRKNTDLCGFVTQTVETIDIYNLTNHLSDKINPHSVNLKQVGGSNKNLLDNWDFTIPVNQRGETSYTSGYCIDRWKITGQGTVTVNSGSLTLQRSGSWFNFFQIIDHPEQLGGKTVTFSVKGSGNYNLVLYVNGTYPTTANYNNAAVGIASVTYTLPAELTSFVVYIQPKSDSIINTIYSSKLEIGSVSTLANDPPMDYQLEYLKCLRYYYQGKVYAPYIYKYNNVSHRYFVRNVLLPLKMRIAPTLGLPDGELSTEEGYNTVIADEYEIISFHAKTLDGSTGGISDTSYDGIIVISASADL